MAPTLGGRRHIHPYQASLASTAGYLQALTTPPPVLLCQLLPSPSYTLTTAHQLHSEPDLPAGLPGHKQGQKTPKLSVFCLPFLLFFCDLECDFCLFSPASWPSEPRVYSTRVRFHRKRQVLRKLQWCLLLSLQHTLQSPFPNPNITSYLKTDAISASTQTTGRATSPLPMSVHTCGGTKLQHCYQSQHWPNHATMADPRLSAG